MKRAITLDEVVKVLGTFNNNPNYNRVRIEIVGSVKTKGSSTNDLDLLITNDLTDVFQTKEELIEELDSIALLFHTTLRFPVDLYCEKLPCNIFNTPCYEKDPVGARILATRGKVSYHPYEKPNTLLGDF